MNIIILWFVILQVISAVPDVYSNLPPNVTEQVPVAVATDIRRIVTDLPHKLKKQILETTSSNPGKRFNLDTGQYESTTTAPSNLIINKNNKRYRIKLTKKPGTGVKKYAGNSTTSVHNKTQIQNETTTSRPSYNESPTYYISRKNGSSAGDLRSSNSANSSKNINMNNYSLSQNYTGTQKSVSSEKVAVSDDKVKPKQKYRVTTHKTTTTTHRKISNPKVSETHSSNVEEEEQRVIHNICKTLKIEPKDVRLFIKKYDLDISKEEDLEELKTVYDDFLLKLSKDPKSNNPKTFKELFLQELTNSKVKSNNDLISAPVNTFEVMNDTEMLIGNLTHFLKPFINISPNETEKLLLNITSPLDAFNKTVYKLANGGAIRVEKAKGNDYINRENIERYIIKTTASSKEEPQPPVSSEGKNQDSGSSETNQKESYSENSLTEYESKKNKALNSILRQRTFDSTDSDNVYSDESSIGSGEDSNQKTKLSLPYDNNNSFTNSEQSSEETVEEDTNISKGNFVSRFGFTSDTKSPVPPLRLQEYIIKRLKNIPNNTNVLTATKNTERSNPEGNSEDESVIGLPSTIRPDAGDTAEAGVLQETTTQNLDTTTPSVSTDIDAHITGNHDTTDPSVTTDINLSKDIPQTNKDGYTEELTTSVPSVIATTAEIYPEPQFHERDDSLTVDIPDATPEPLTTISGTVSVEDIPSLSIDPNTITTERTPTAEFLTTRGNSVSLTPSTTRTIEETTLPVDLLTDFKDSSKAQDNTDSVNKDVLETTEDNILSYIQKIISQAIEKTKTSKPVKGMIREDILTSILDRQLPLFIKQVKQNNPDIDDRQVHLEVLIELIRRFPYFAMMIIERIHKLNYDYLPRLFQNKHGLKNTNKIPFNLLQIQDKISNNQSGMYILNVGINDNSVTLKLLKYLMEIYPQSRQPTITAINKIIQMSKGNGDIDIRIKGSLHPGLVTKKIGVTNIFDKEPVFTHTEYHRLPEIINNFKEKYPSNVNNDLIKILSNVYPAFNDFEKPKQQNSINNNNKLPENLSPHHKFKKFTVNNVPQFQVEPNQDWSVSKSTLLPKIKQSYLSKDIQDISLYPNFKITNYQKENPNQKFKAGYNIDKPEIISEIEFSKMVKIPVRGSKPLQHKDKFLIPYEEMYEIPENEDVLQPNDQPYLVVTPKTNTDFHPRYADDQHYLVVTPKSAIIHSRPKYSFLDNLKVNNDVAKWASQRPAFFNEPKNNHFLTKNPIPAQYLSIRQPFMQKSFLRTPIEDNEDPEIVNNNPYMKLGIFCNNPPSVVTEPNFNYATPVNLIKIHSNDEPSNDPVYYSVNNDPEIIEENENFDHSHNDNPKVRNENGSSDYSYSSETKLNKENKVLGYYGSNESQVINDNENLEYSDGNESVISARNEVSEYFDGPKIIIGNGISESNDTEITTDNYNNFESLDISKVTAIKEAKIYNVSPENLVEKQNHDELQANKGPEYSDTTVPISRQETIVTSTVNPEIFTYTQNKNERTTEVSLVTSAEQNVIKEVLADTKPKNPNEINYRGSNTNESLENKVGRMDIGPFSTIQSNDRPTSQESLLTSVNNEPYVIKEIQADLNPENLITQPKTTPSSVYFQSNDTKISENVNSNSLILKNLIVNADDIESELHLNLRNSTRDDFTDNKLTKEINSDTLIEKYNDDEPKHVKSSEDSYVTKEIKADDILGKDRSGSDSNEAYDLDVPDTIEKPNVKDSNNNNTNSATVEQLTNDLTVEQASKLGVDNSQIELLLDLPRGDLEEQYQDLTKDILNSALGKLKTYLRNHSVVYDVILRIEDDIREDMQEMFDQPKGSCPDVQIKNFVNKLTNSIKEHADKFLHVGEI